MAKNVDKVAENVGSTRPLLTDSPVGIR
jgi:hypothetical protein